jgi:hypothetical protein
MASDPMVSPDTVKAPVASKRVAGYTVVLPPAWRKIPVRHGTDKAIKEIVDDAFANLSRGDVPRDRLTPYRMELGRQLTAAARRARQQGGTELYLPVELEHGTVIAASFVVSEGLLGDTEDPRQVAACMAAEDEAARPVEIDGAVGVRTERVAPPDPAEGIEYGSRRVDYVLSVPGDPGRWLVVAFSALSAGDPDDKFAKLLVDLFDAIISTFRWTRS